MKDHLITNGEVMEEILLMCLVQVMDTMLVQTISLVITCVQNNSIVHFLQELDLGMDLTVVVYLENIMKLLSQAEEVLI